MPRSPPNKAWYQQAYEWMKSPRAVGIYLLVASVFSIAGLAFIGGAFPGSIFYCGAILALYIIVTLLAAASHFVAVTYMLTALRDNQWPWNKDTTSHVNIHNTATETTTIPDAEPLLDTTAAALEEEQEPLSAAAIAPRTPKKRAAPKSGAYWCRVAVCSTCVITALFIYVFACIGLWLRNNTLPNYTGNMNLPGLKAPVSLLREDLGVVHVMASNVFDAFAAQGYAHAEDRLWQMEFQRRVGAGRLAQVAGSAALKIDKAMRTLAVYPAAVRAYSALTNTSQQILQAYAAGVNAYINDAASGKQSLPLEFALLGYSPEPWTVTDSLVWAKLMSYSLSGNMDKELTRYKLFAQQNLTVERVNQMVPPFDFSRFPTVLSWTNINPPYGPGMPNISSVPADVLADNYRSDGASVNTPSGSILSVLAEAKRVEAAMLKTSARTQEKRKNSGSCSSGLFGNFTPVMNSQYSYGGALRLGVRMNIPGASNDWVVGGSKTQSGFPLLCNDPHLQFMAPSIWMLMHLSASDGSVNAIGATFPGVPGVVLGHNDHIAWGVTNTGVDVQDLYIMSGNFTHYSYNGQMVPYQLQQETVYVKGESPVSITVRTSVYGTVVTDNGLVDKINVPMSMRWISTDPTVPDTTLDAFLNINFATDWTTFRAALSHYIAPSQNFVFADVNKNFGYVMSGYVPLRNPAAGYTGGWPSPGDGNATYTWRGRVPFESMPYTYNPPEGFIATANNRVVPPNYTFFLTADWDEGSDGYRAKRITEMIQATNQHDVASMQAIQQNYHSLLADDILGAVTNLTLPALSANAQKLLAVFAAWDHTMDIGSAQATLWAQLWRKLATLGAEQSGQDYWPDMVWVYNVITSDSSPSGTDAACTIKGFSTCAAFVASALESVAGAYSFSETDLSNVPLWGSALHMADFEHQILTGSPLQCLANRQIVRGGDDSTVNVGHMDLSDDSLPQTAGPSFRQVADLQDVQQSVFIHPMGQDGNILSFNYDSLLTDWAFGRYLQMVSSQQLVQQASTISQTLNP